MLKKLLLLFGVFLFGIYFLNAHGNMEGRRSSKSKKEESKQHTTNAKEHTSSETVNPYTAVPDPNFEAALSAYDDIPNDGQVPTNNISGVSTLFLNNLNISDLTGIQGFTDLRILEFNDNSVDSLDVSQNTGLFILRLRNNNVSNLDLSANPSLTQVLVENNGLETINVSNNFFLQRLYVGGNSLTELDLSNNSNLQIVGVNVNNLSTLNIQNGNNTNITTFVAGNNPNLTCILVDDAAYSIANWTNVDSQSNFIDTSCYTSIPDSNFEALLSAYDDIPNDGQVPTAAIQGVTTLDVSNSSIADLTGIEGFTALTDLNCERNSLMSLNLQKNTNLQTLNCAINNLGALDLQYNTALQNLNCQRNSITNLDLQYNTALKGVNCERNTMTLLNVSNNPLLESLDCERNSLSELDVTNNPLLETLVARVTQISELNLSQNTALRIFLGDGTRISKLTLNTNTLLETVVVGSNHLTEINIKNQNNTSITNFNASNSPNLTCIAVDDVAYSTANWTQVDNSAVFSASFCNYTAITDPNFEAALDNLGYDDIAADGQVPTSLISNLIFLNVSNRLISDVTGIEDFTALQTLNINGNSVSTIDISNNTALTSFSARENTLSRLQVNSNTALETIAVQDNNIDSLNVSQNGALRYLGIARNSIATLDLTNNTNLSELYATTNGLTGTIDLSNNPNLTVVGLNGNNITGLDMRSGNNIAVTTFTTAGNPNLYCVLVDDVDYSTTNWTAIDAQTIFSDTSCYTQIPDPNFEIALGDLGYDDIPGDGQVPKGIIAGVTILNIINKSISDLTGIEDFVSLTELRIAANPITEINLTNNTALEVLTANDCDISTINIAGLTQLRNLYIQLNELTSLNFSAFPNLENIDVSSNLLTSLNIRNGNSTTLLTMNARNNDDLTCIFIDNLSDVNNTWFKDNEASYTETDYCDYTAIPDTNFEERLNDLGYDDIAGDGQVPTDLITNVNSLNVASNNISNLTGIQAFTALQIFNASDNPATAIAIDSLTQLLEVNLGNTGISSLNTGNNRLLKVLRIDESAVTALDITNNEQLEVLNADDIGVLTDITFGNNTLLKNVVLSGNQLTSIDLSPFPMLKIVRLNNNNFTNIRLNNGNNSAIIDFSARVNPNLSCILVDDVTAFDMAWGTFVDNANISDTFCDYTSIPDPNFEARLEALGYDDISNDGQVPTALIMTVTSLDVSDQSINDLNGIQDFENLQTLNASNNSMTTIPLDNLMQLVTIQADSSSINTISFPANSLIENLSLNANNLSVLNVQNLTQLKTLSAHSNNLNGISLNANTALETVQLSNNSLTSLVVTLLTNLKTLELNDNLLSGISLDANTALEVLRLDDNELSSIELINNTNLQIISLNNNELTAANFKNGNNTTITDFSITGNSELTCIFVDDATYSTTNWTQADAQVQYVDTDFCEYTLIPDANFETRLRQLGYDDVPNDGRVPTELIATVTSLNLFNRGISDLTGIQDFAALETLAIGQNSLISLNVSSNTQLRDLSANDNLLTSVSLGANINLQDIQLNNNNLSSISLTGLTGLNTINLNGNPLNSLNLADQGALQELYLNSNPLLASLDLTNKTALREVFLNNCIALASITFANNPMLGEIVLSATALTSIDVSPLTALREININDTAITEIDFSSNTFLRKVFANNTQLTSLDLSSNTGIRDVFIENTSISFLNIQNGNNTNINNFAFRVENNPNLFCILVDDANYSTTTWTNVDMQVTFSDTFCRYTAIPDANFEAALGNLGYDDISSDGQVPTALIEGVTSLSVEGVNAEITNLTGIEAFTVLTHLDIDFNNLGDLDLRANTNLISLDCEAAGITSLNIEGLELLEELKCKFNPLGTLTIATNTNLKKLDCADTGISTLDVSMLPLLTALDCSLNTLTALNIRNGNNINFTNFNATTNPNLACIFVDDAAFAEINFTNVDAGVTFSDTAYCDYTAIPDANFEAKLESLGYDDISGDGRVPTVFIEGITSLDIESVSATTAIQNLTGIEAFTALEHLNMRNNNVSDVDLRSNTNLITLICDSSSIDSINITGLQQLEEVDCKLNSFSSINLTTNINIKKLDCRDAGLGELDVSVLPLLTDLDCSFNFFTTLNIKNGNNVNFTNFNATNNPNLTCIFVDDAAFAETNFTNVDAGITFTDTNYCEYTAVPDPNFEAQLAGFDDIPNDGRVPTALIANRTTLSVTNDNISDLTGIEGFTSLRLLRATNNNLTTVDLRANTALEQVFIQNNRLTNININGLTSLRELQLDNNNLSSIDVSTNTSLATVTLSSNTNLPSIDVRATINLTSLLVSDCSSLQTIIFGNNTLLTTVTANNTGITSLDVNSLIGLRQLTLNNTSVTLLNLINNPNLRNVNVANANLTALNIKNGNNTAITSFDASNNPNLTCISVDDAAYSTTNWTNIDVQTAFTDAYCRYTAIPDAAFEAELEAIGLDDITADGQVPTALIEIVNSLSIGSAGITDITGIEDFAALENFVINANTITTVNLSSNTNLKLVEFEDTTVNNLVLDNNPLLESIEFEGAGQSIITDLDLSNSPLLQRIDVNNVGLVNLTLPAQLPNLEILFISGNNFASIDASGYPALERISFSNNPNLSYFDFRNGNNANILSANLINVPSLTCVLVDDVAYATTNFTNIDSQISFNEIDCIVPTLTCPSDITVGNDVGVCGADLTIPTVTITDDNTGAVQSDDLESYTVGPLLGQDDNWVTWTPNTPEQSANVSTEQARSGTKSIKFTGISTGGPEDMNYNLGNREFGAWELKLYVYIPSGNTAAINLQKSETSGTEVGSQVFFFSDGTGIHNVNRGVTNFTFPQDTWFEIKYVINTDGDNSEFFVEGTSIASHPFTYIPTGTDGTLTTLGAINFYPVTVDILDPNPTATPLYYVDDISLSPIAVNDYNNSSDASDVYPVGTTDVVWKYTDEGGNTATCTQVMTVNDTEAPQVANCPDNITVTSCNATVTYDVPLALDNCDVTAITGFTYLGKFENKAYYLSEADFNAPDAFIDAEAQNGFVATIDSQGLNDWLRETTDAAGTGSVIIGFTDREEEREFKWHSGSTSDYTNWNDNEPNDFRDGEDYVELRSNGRWNDINSTSARKYVLELSGFPMTQTAGLPSGSDFPIGTTTNTFEATDTVGNTITCSFDVTVEAVNGGCVSQLSMRPKVYLQGAAINPVTGEENLMRDNLRASGFIPTRSPYVDMLACEQTVLDVTGNNAIVDWVWVELRDVTDNEIVALGRSALLQRDGDVVDVDGVSPLNYSNVENSYYVVIKHRNHLGVMTNSAITFTDGVTETIDFTTITTFGTNAQTIAGMPASIAGMWSGNANQDIRIQYSGTNPDTPAILATVLNDPSNFLNFPTFSITKYNTNDVNMDGIIQYSGTNPDTPFILQNVLAHPGNFLNFSTYQIIEQLPENISNTAQ
ncbi:HYR domain-containing protein [Kordia jejudonensis]|uniref:HYR domain-containing protein n=1 Tax=Kordia jejudonensis TaxID=1348245 RepID=UPI0006294BC7|nr:HYR domain-containing protein [Kordia jejudonensis]